MRVLLHWPFMRSEEAVLGPALADAGLDTTILTLDRPGAPAAVDQAGLRVAPVLREVADRRRWTPGWVADRAAAYLQRVRLRRRYAAEADVVHIWFVNRFLDAFAIPRLARTRTVYVHVHDVMPHALRMPGFVERWLVGRIYRSGAVLTVHHQSLADELRDRFGADDTHVIPLMVRPQTLRTEHPGTRRVLFFGTFRANKGLPQLLQAITADTSATIEWRIVGRGEPELEAAVSGADVPHLTTHVGWVDEDAKAAHYDWADVVVMPYTAFESQSGVLHDAYAQGVPVIVTDVGALGRSVREDGTGVVIESAAPALIGDAVRRLLDDDDARRGYADAIRLVAHERRPEAIAAMLADLYGSR